MNITLRPEQAGDQEFLFTLYASTRAQELERVPWSDAQKKDFLRMQFNAQSAHYHQHYPGAAFEIILSGQQPVGRLYVDRGSDEIHVIDIALLPGYCGAGIGGNLLRGLLGEAEAVQKPVRIYVEQQNPAARLYARLGFKIVENKGIYSLLEWQGKPKVQVSPTT